MGHCKGSRLVTPNPVLERGANMKQLTILIAAVAMIGFLSSESYGQHYHGGGHRGGGTAWGVSLGNGYGNGVTFGQGPRGNSFYGLNIGGGGGYGYGGYAPVYRPVYRPVYQPVPVYGGGFYGGGFYGGGRGCRGW
jgi:hypothetical protein